MVINKSTGIIDIRQLFMECPFNREVIFSDNNNATVTRRLMDFTACTCVRRIRRRYSRDRNNQRSRLASCRV